ncbi:MAG: hypothetical protein ACLUTA_17520 [Blautia wexlerae]
MQEKQYPQLMLERRQSSGAEEDLMTASGVLDLQEYIRKEMENGQEM